MGVKDYGAPETRKENRDSFLYRFEVNGAEVIYSIDNGARDENGAFAYPVQNALKEGYRYLLTVEEGVVKTAREIPDPVAEDFKPFVSGVPGVKTLKNFLLTALEPVGTTLYIYGGGWDWQDEGSAVQARTIGVSPDWVRFFNANDAHYTYKEQDGDKAKADPAASYYPYGGYNEYYYAGLDCSGYLGWAIYNTVETESGGEGYVGGSTGSAARLAGYGWGERTQDIKMPDGKNGYTMKPGDVMSINGHVWISLGTCPDGSVLIVHSTPSYSRAGQPGGGVQLSAIGYSKDCGAYRLAEKVMSEHYPEWFERYPVYLTDPGVYFAFSGDSAGRFSWYVDGSSGILTDPEHVQEMTPAEIVAEIYG
ncbi:MAG: hypothetical protein ILO53_04260 [Clostridia bacterium]|nr:hypothetical protein [Clostridia bacterium]